MAGQVTYLETHPFCDCCCSVMGEHEACCGSVLSRCHVVLLLSLECSDHFTFYICSESHPPTQGMGEGFVWEGVCGALHPALTRPLFILSSPWLLAEGVDSTFLLPHFVTEHKMLAKQVSDLDPESNI